MKRVRHAWRGLTGGERAVLGAAVALIAATLIFAAVAFVKRPADISNPDVAFQAKPAKDDESTAPKGRKLDWPRYGYDTERTKFLDVQKVKPPFRKLWRYDQDQLIEFAPIVKGKRMYMIDNDGVFIALNVDTGKVVWKKQHGKLNASSPAFYKGVLYAVSLQPPQALAVRAKDGKAIWRKSLPGRAESSPMVVRDRMYFGTETGDFFALRTKDGKAIWQTSLAGSVKAAPAFSDGNLYVGDYAGKMYSLRASDGAIRWQTSDLGVGAGRSGRFYSTPAVAFGRVYVGNVDGRVYSFDQKTGQIAWTFSAGDFVYSGIAAGQTPGTGPSVYFGSHDKNVYSLDAKSGSVNWKVPPGGQVSGPATVIGDVAYFSTFSGNSTVGLDLKTGRRVFKFEDGEYGPVVSDGERLYLTGGSSVVAFKPVKVSNFRPNPGMKGVVPPAELRKARKRERKRNAGAEVKGGQQQAAGGGKGEKRSSARKQRKKRRSRSR